MLNFGQGQGRRGLKSEPDAEIGQISADFERWRFAKVSLKCQNFISLHSQLIEVIHPSYGAGA